MPGDRFRIGVVRSSTAVEFEKRRDARLLSKRKKFKRSRHKNIKVAFFHYGQYECAFKFFAEQVLDAEFLCLPKPTARTAELGALYSNDYVCTPFKHHLGDYIEALERGANVIVQFCGPCRLGYYGELQESILRDLGYEFEMLNFSNGVEQGLLGWAKDCLKIVNPDVNLARGLRQLKALSTMVVLLDKAHDFYLANAGFETKSGSFNQVWKTFIDNMNIVTNEREINRSFNEAMESMRSIEISKPQNPVRIGIVGEFFTAIDERSNLDLDKKLLDLGVEVHRNLSLTSRYIHYNEANLRTGASEYLEYDMGPTSTITVATAKKYAQEGYDGIIHAKSSGCTPEIDCVPVLQCLSADLHIPILYLTYDSQTSDTGLDTRLEAFYDMLVMKKEKRQQ